MAGTSIHEITDHNLKIALRTVLEKECGHLFSAYGYRVKSIFCGFSPDRQAYRLAIAIFDPSYPNNVLNVQREISWMELTRHTLHYGDNVSIINQNTELFSHYFHAIACDIRREIEKKTKDMPPMGVYSRGPVTAASNYAVNCMNANYANVTMTINEARYLQELPEKIVNNYNGIKSKFEHIDALIASSKTRLSGSYASPRFEFKHF